MKLMNIVGARPNFMKIAPLMKQYALHPEINASLIHTGQHYDRKMSDLFFNELEIPEPLINLGVGSGSHASQTAEIMKRIEPVLISEQPDAVLVVGDVNSTIACGLVAVKLGIKLFHVEAGLRSFDRTMPEEINRILTDSISDLLFCTENSGVKNLKNEGIAANRIHFVGHVMIDTLFMNLEKAQNSTIMQKLFQANDQQDQNFVLLTLHRPSNVDNLFVLQKITDVIEEVQKDQTVIFPIHPRTLKNISNNGIRKRLDSFPNLHIIEPLGYLDFIKLMSKSSIVITDSGGIQEETTALCIPCLTIRNNTERPITVEVGSNQLVGTDPEKILAGYKRIKEDVKHEYSIPPLWDGKSAERIVSVILNKYCI